MKSVFTNTKKAVNNAKALFAGFILVISLSLFTEEAHATHCMGMDIYYEHVGNSAARNKFKVTLVFYRDCAGVPEPGGPITANVRSVACAQNYNMSLTRQPDPVGGPEVSPLCPPELINSTCSGGTNPGVEKYIYQGTIDLLNNFCDDWVFSYSLCCRNNAIDNLANLGNQYVEATMNNSIVAGDTIWNNSATFSSLPTPYICINQSFSYNHGTVDVDGDSLSFYLINALSAANTNIGFSGVYSLTDPIISTPSITLDTVTGQMSMTPIMLQNCVITTRVEEWRDVNGTMTKVGTTMRDLQIVVMNCSNVQPVVNGATGIQGVTNGVKTGSFTAEVCPGDSLSFYFVATDANGNNILMTTNLGANNMPTASFSYSCVCAIDTGYFGYRPLVADIGLHVMVVTVQDDGCPVLGAQYYGFNIWVQDGLYGGADQVYCGIPQTLSAAGGDTLVWTVLSGDSPIIIGTNFSDDSIIVASESSAQAYPSVTTTYLVTSNLSATCGNTDTVVVTVAAPFTLTAVPDTAICLNGIATLDIPTEDPTYPSYNYSWTPTSTLGTPSQKSTAAQPTLTPIDSIYYYVTALAPSGCERKDTVKVVVAGTAPTVTAAATDYTLCAGDTIRLSCTTLPGATYQWSPSTGLFDSTGANTMPDTLASPWAIPTVTTVYTVQVDTTTVTNCPGSDLVTITVGPDYTVSATANPRLICRGDASQLTATPSIGGTYSYSWTPTLSILIDTIANPNAYPSDTTIYTVVLDNGGCVKSDTALVNVKPAAPSITVEIDSPYTDQICAGDSTSLRATAGMVNSCATSTGNCSSSPLSDSINYPTYNLTAMGHLTGAKTGWAHKSQVLYTVSDLVSIGMVADDMISAVAFRCTAGAGNAVNNIVMKMGCTPSPGWTTADTTFITGLTTVMASFSYTPVAGWNTFTFDAPYIWDGVSNLVMEFCTDTYQSNDVYFAFDTLEFGNKTRYILSTSMTVPTQCAVAVGLPYSSFTLTGMPETKFRFCQGPAIASSNIKYLWAPTTNLSNPNDSATMAWPTTTTTYQISAWDSTTDGCVGVGIKTIYAGSDYGLTATTTDDSICLGESVTLGASIDSPFVFTYSWVPTATLDTATKASPIATPTTTTAYEITTSRVVWGCERKDTVTVVVQGVPPSLTASNDTFNCPGDSVDIGVTLNTSLLNPTYSWTPTTAMGSPTDSTTKVAPVAATRYKVTVDDGGCSDTASLLVTPSTAAVSADTIGVCDGNDTMQLQATVTGMTAPGGGAVSSCGANGTSAGTTNNYNPSVATGGQWNGEANPFEGTKSTGYHIQLLYLGANMVTGGMSATGMVITELGFNVNDVAAKNSTYNGYTVKMICTSVGALTNSVWESTVGASTVYSGNFNLVTTGAGLVSIPLSSSFDWDGSSNILIDICWTSVTGDLYAMNYDFMNFVYQGGQYGFSACGGAASAAVTYQPMPTFKAGTPTGSFTYNWTPGVNMDDSTIANPKVKILVDPTTYVVVVTGGECDVTDSIVAQCACDVDSPYIEGSASIDTTEYQTDSTFRIYINELVECTNIGTADFELVCTGSSTAAACLANSFVSATGFGCPNPPDSTTQWISVEMANPVPSNYMNDWRIRPVVGNDVVDVCGNPLTQVGSGGATGAAVILPIEMLYFTGEIDKEGVVNLTWETALESNIDYYIVQRSTNELEFENIGNVAAQGALNKYLYKDRKPNNGINYYRLKVMDKDGKYSYTSVISFRIEETKFDLVSIRPIPTIDNLNVVFTSNANERVKIEVINLIGEKILVEEFIAKPGKNEKKLNLRGFKSGVYFLSIHNNKKAKILTKIVKQ